MRSQCSDNHVSEVADPLYTRIRYGFAVDIIYCYSVISFFCKKGTVRYSKYLSDIAA